MQMRVLLFALQDAWRGLLVPCIAMLMMILVLSAAMHMGGPPKQDDKGRYQNDFDAMWAIILIVSTMSYGGKLIVVISLMCGIMFTTIPITIFGDALRAAWKKKEVLEFQMKVQDILVQRGLTINELGQVFKGFDTGGDGNLDWNEYKAALSVLKMNLPLSKKRELFRLFDEDESGMIDYHEFCRPLFPDLANRRPSTGRAQSDRERGGMYHTGRLQ